MNNPYAYRVKRNQQGYSIFANLMQASALLKDSNLVWSQDLEAIRIPLALTLDTYAMKQQYDNPHLEELAVILLRDENDLTV